jgi:homoserine kinase type II
VPYDDVVRSTLRTVWHRVVDDLTPLSTGPSSRTWDVTIGDDRYVAKLVPATQRNQFEAGLAAAERLRTRGVDAGAPARTVTGALTAVVDQGVVALLRHVAGRPLDGADPIDQQFWGDLLGTAHRELEGFHHPGLARWTGIRTDAAHLDLEPWLRPAITDAVAALTKLTVTDQLTYGVLHGEPAPDAFRLDPQTGRLGLIDWGSAGTGPLMLDAAAAVRYAGGVDAADELLDGYAAAGPVPQDEIGAALATLLRYCWAARADAYARRLAAAVPDAGADAAPNADSDAADASDPADAADAADPAARVGLDEARDALAQFSPITD